MQESRQYGEIIADLGSASGGASKAQRVRVRDSEGTEWEAFAKFAQDTNGQPLAENGAHGLAAEFLAGQLATALAANVPMTEPVVLRSDMPMRASNGATIAPGLAVASKALRASVDVNGPATMPTDTLPGDVASLVALHSWIEAQDRGHNLILSDNRVYSIDHATGFRSAWNLTDPTGDLVVDPLLQPIFSAHPETVGPIADRLQRVLDATINRAVQAAPREWVPSDALRTRLVDNIKRQRDLVARSLVARGAGTA